MRTSLYKQIALKLRKYIQTSNSILVAVSSGQDSLFLVELLSNYINRQNHKIIAVYIDHQWKKDSANHTNHIINLMRTKKIPIIIYQIKLLAISENSARKIRYKTLLKCAKVERCQIIMTGHNKNDKVETFLQNIMRGSGLNGVTNLTLQKQFSRKISILRPLIDTSRSEITRICRLLYLPIWSDVTNYNLEIKRNRLRHELIPYLQNYFNPQIENSLTRFIHLCQDEDEYLKENTLKLYLKTIHKFILCLNLNQLKSQHFILQKRVIKLFFYYHFHQQIKADLLKRILSLDKSKIKSFFFLNTIIIYHYNGKIYAYK